MADIHIAALGYDAELITGPVETYRPARVYLLRMSLESVMGYRFTAMNAFVALEAMTDVVVKEVNLELASIIHAVEAIVDTELRAGNNILINISSGPRLLAVAAAMVASRRTIELYYVERQTYEVTRNFTSGIEKIVRLPSLKWDPSKQPVNKVPVDSNFVFVLMPFQPRFAAVYEDVIGPVISRCGLRCRRADDVFGSRPIMDDVWEGIRQSRLVISDLTTRNANVFYETGIAHALGKEVLLVTQSADDVPFDLKHLRYILYNDSIRGARDLSERLEKAVKFVLDQTAIV